MTHNKIAAAIAIAFLTGCSTLHQDNLKTVQDKTKDLEALLPPPVSKKPADASSVLDISPLPSESQMAKERAWLRNRKVTFIPKDPVPASEVLKAFRENGINIGSTLALDSYMYNGNGVKNADGETALNIILGRMGLDYDIDSAGKYITVVPMKSRTWSINLGNRSSTYTGSTFESQCPTATTSSTSSSNTQGPSQSNAMSGQTQGGSLNQTGQSQTTSKDNFWLSLTTELTARLSVLIPTKAPVTGMAGATGAPSISQPNMAYPGGPNTMGGPTGSPMAQATEGGSELYTKQKIGHFAINPETGAVTVQAPAWMLQQLDPYLSKIVAKYNTSMTFEGLVVNVRANKDQTKGFDLSALATYAGKYGFFMSNNILGGINLSNTAGTISANFNNSSSLPGSGATFGMVSPKDNLQLFNAFLTTIGGVDVINRPIVTVMSGVPADFGRLTPIYTNEPTSQIAAGNVNTNALAVVNNNVLEHRYGSLLRIMPSYDPDTRRVRAQISLLQKPLVGFQPLTLSIMSSNGTIQNQTIRKPQIECSVTNTEAVLDDGELIVIGGQIEDSTENNHAGVTGAMEMPGVEYLTSQRRDTITKTTMYFALRVRLNPPKAL